MSLSRPRGSRSHGASADLPTGYRVSRIFGQRTFSNRIMEERLPSDTRERLQETIRSGALLDESVACVVAHAMKEWALAGGATHYCHWFQPLTGLTAEKHDSFLALDDAGHPLERFSGQMLRQGEPDASSFPSGGLRTTFEARGYTAWDPSSPAFLMEGPHATTLCIPSVFTTYMGQAMDMKTPLLRSSRNLTAAAERLLGLLGCPERGPVSATVGCEQEYFLLERRHLDLRPDLRIAGRTLLGAPPAKGQQLEDHYFGAIQEPVQGYMQDVEEELYRLGVPIKTRHNEVAPCQFETAPIFEEANIAADHNFLTMEVMRRVGLRHDLAVLFHEKPFAGINGSGKHCNWSLVDGHGSNLLEPGDSPEENYTFLAFFCAVLEGVRRHARLLRAGTASSGNDHRLGASEAPPAVISVFVGEALETLLDRIVAGDAAGASPQQVIDLGLRQIQGLVRHNTDRNRTSPFAFTGNKFEFRALGASMAVSTPVAYLNAAVAESLGLLCDRIEAHRARAQEPGLALMGALRETIEEARPVIYGGNNYSPEWLAEAERRGLPNLSHTCAALAVLQEEETVAFLAREGILSREETAARHQAKLERYILDLDIELQVLMDLARTRVLPAALEGQRRASRSLEAVRRTLERTPGLQAQTRHLEATVSATERLALRLEEAGTLQPPAEDDLRARGEFARHEIRPALERLRECCDELECVLPHDVWPLPRYQELLFLH